MVNDILISSLKIESAILRSTLRETVAECDRLRSSLSLIAEVIPEYASEAWMVQTAKDALDGVTNE